MQLAPGVLVELLVILVDNHFDVPPSSAKAGQHLGGNLADVAGGLDVPLDLDQDLVGDLLTAGHGFLRQSRKAGRSGISPGGLFANSSA